MSGPRQTGAAWRLARLPEPLRPRDEEAAGTGSLRLVETTLLLLVALLLAVATINDVGREAHNRERLAADLATWRHYTGHNYRNVRTDQELFGHATKREAVCGNTSPGALRARIQLCLDISGPVRDGRRTVYGGWYLPPGSEDQRRDRYACFGRPASEGLCPAQTGR